MTQARLSSRQVFEFACYKIKEGLEASELNPIITELESGGVEFKCEEESIYLFKPVMDAISAPKQQADKKKAQLPEWDPEWEADVTWELDASLPDRVQQIEALKRQYPEGQNKPIFILPLKESYKANTRQWVLLVDQGNGWELWDPRKKSKSGFGHSQRFITEGLRKKSEEITITYAGLQSSADKNSSCYFVGHLAKSVVATHSHQTKVIPEENIDNLVQQAKFLFAKPIEPTPTYPMLTAVFKGLIAGLIVAGVIVIILVAAGASFGGSVIPTVVGGAVGGAALGAAVRKRKSSKQDQDIVKQEKMKLVGHNLGMPSSDDSIGKLKGLSTITMQSALSSPTPASRVVDDSHQSLAVPAAPVSSPSSSPRPSVLGKKPVPTSEAESPLKTCIEEDSLSQSQNSVPPKASKRG